MGKIIAPTVGPASDEAATTSPSSAGSVAGQARELNEPELPDDYPIYADYLYVADGKVVRSDWHGITARQYRLREGVKELRRCDIVGRQGRSQ